jgi:restriction endonuclease Mrr
LSPLAIEEGDSPVGIDLLVDLIRDPPLRHEWLSDRDPTIAQLFSEALMLIGGLSVEAQWDNETLLDMLGCRRRSRDQLMQMSESDVKRCIAYLEAITDRDRHEPGLDGIRALIRTAGSAYSTVFDASGSPVDLGQPEFEAVELSVKDSYDELIAKLAEHPEVMYEMDPRPFEELMAELYSREGHEVELTRATKDGGVDIYVMQQTSWGLCLTVVDCKRYRPDFPVDVGLVTKLYGTVNAKGASMGAIATTSYFTDPAKQFQQQFQHRIGLQDFHSIRDMIERARRRL